MKSIKGIVPEFTTIANDNLNIFCSRFDKTDVIMCQPRRGDSGRSRLAWRELSEYTLKRYKRKNADQKIYDMKYRCGLPLYRGEIPGFLPLIMEVDNTIVGFVDAFFKYGTEFPRFNIQPEETAMSASVGILDKYQGLGLGIAYSHLTDEIGRYFNMDWILGVAHLKDGTYNIRMKDGWETIRKYGEYADHRLRLKPFKAETLN